MKAFDPQQVTLGTPVIVQQFQGAGTPGRYLAKMEDGRHVVELIAVNGTHFVNVFDDECVFMAPVKRTVYVTLYKSGCADWTDEPVAVSRMLEGFLAGPIEIEIEV